MISSALVACAGAEPPPKEPAAVEAPPAIDDPSKLGYEAEVGGLPEEAMERAFAGLGKDVERCVSDGAARLDAIGGKIGITLRIDTHGNLESAFVSESGLGDRPTEKCILEAAKRRSWPHAVGGVGVASTSFEATPSRDRALLDTKLVRPAIGQARAVAQRCVSAPSDFVVTAYVRPDGRVQAAGLSMSSAEAEEAADCIVDAVRKVRFGNPGRASKLSFAL